MRVLVCGGRDLGDWKLVHRTLYRSKVFQSIRPTVIHGGARGADEYAGRWARVNGFKEEAFPADWKTHGKAAGPIRNQQMIDEGKPDLVIAFPGGRGTADMVRRARKAGIEVMEVEG